MVTPATVAYAYSATGGSNGGSTNILASASFSGDPTFGQTLPPNYLYDSIYMPAACTFDTLAVNANAVGLAHTVDSITVTLMARTPNPNAVFITGPSITIPSFAPETYTATGSMAVPAGSFVWLQIAGPGLTGFDPDPGDSPIVIGVTSHCS
jgi:hypothetical protein